MYAASIQAPALGRSAESAFLGVQRGATGSKRAMGAIVGFGMRHQEHFEAAISEAAVSRCPFS